MLRAQAVALSVRDRLVNSLNGATATFEKRGLPETCTLRGGNGLRQKCAPNGIDPSERRDA